MPSWVLSTIFPFFCLSSFLSFQQELQSFLPLPVTANIYDEQTRCSSKFHTFIVSSQSYEQVLLSFSFIDEEAEAQAVVLGVGPRKSGSRVHVFNHSARLPLRSPHFHFFPCKYPPPKYPADNLPVHFIVMAEVFWWVLSPLVDQALSYLHLFPCLLQQSCLRGDASVPD